MTKWAIRARGPEQRHHDPDDRTGGRQLSGAAERTVRVEPLGAEIRVPKGERLMAAAERLGYHWPTLCHGQAACTTCWVEVDDPDAFEPPAPLEVKGLGLFDGRSFYAGKDIRLACQARPLRDTVVTKRGVRGPSDSRR